MNFTDQLHSCCFTGYRPEKFSFDFIPGLPEYADFENKLTDAVFAAAENGCKLFYSGVARGFDLAAAETVLLLKKSGYKASLCCVLPYRQQAEHWELSWRCRYLNVLKSADEIVVLSEVYQKGCFAKRNSYMVEHSDAVITYFDGVAGGTASTVKLAERKGLYIINIAYEYNQLRIE